jgi:purine operon repressor
MEKLTKSGRVAALVKRLVDNPRMMMSVSEMADYFGVAKSSLSEDIAAIRVSFDKLGLGRLETFAGAQGGIRYVPRRGPDHLMALVDQVCERLSDVSRVVAGGYLYAADILSDPALLNGLGEAIAGVFEHEVVDAVVTVETRGIPLALSVARFMGCRLVIARREVVFAEDGKALPITRQESFVAEGPLLSISYTSGSHRGIQSMSLPRKSLQPGSRVLIVDDFLRAGGTLRGLSELLAEFEAVEAGTVVLMDAIKPQQKLIDSYVSVVEVGQVERIPVVRPGSIVKRR